jgi:PAS domain S-box-containing protein
MAHDEHHEHLVKELTDQLGPVFNNSEQAIYLYLDDTHKSCNRKFADLLGYKSIDEWVKNETPVSDVAEKDQERLIEAYGKASEEFIASKLSGNLIKKDGEEISADIIMVPITYHGEVFVLHFITPK